MSIEQLRGEFPRWHMWAGVAGMLYASLRGAEPPIVVRAHNLTVLRARIEQAELAIRLAAPGGFQGASREPEP